MKPSVVLIAGSVAAIGWIALANAMQTPAKGAETQMNANGKVLGYRVVNGRFAEGPYAGYLVARPNRPDRVEKTDDEWRKLLTPEQYKILRGHGTEAAFCGRFHDNKKDGVYVVAGTGQPVFRSDAKFDSGTGWPSFFQPYDKDAIWLKPDFSYGMTRLEVLATRCDGHLGHVFPDGPGEKGGLRFCINSEALEFVPADEWAKRASGKKSG
ncbi:MAG: peptide-methionine (R)-S-oxide reductase MsrB [Fimbriimonadaceae bacterium]|nr:peptide-methionine (R)-S-oxide reductase MsrB [Fimbriimonadaceae bacterium]